MPSSLTNNAGNRDRGRVREISNEYNFKFYHFVQKVFMIHISSLRRCLKVSIKRF